MGHYITSHVFLTFYISEIAAVVPLSTSNFAFVLRGVLSDI